MTFTDSPDITDYSLTSAPQQMDPASTETFYSLLSTYLFKAWLPQLGCEFLESLHLVSEQGVGMSDKR
jgi:hypothetical protein